MPLATLMLDMVVNLVLIFLYWMVSKLDNALDEALILDNTMVLVAALNTRL